MQLRYFCLLPLLGLYLQSVSQTINLTGDWTNGLEAYSSKKINDSFFLFTGGDLHEGGYAFAVRIGRNNTLSIVPARAVDNSYGETPSIGRTGDKVRDKVINGTKVLIIESPEGVIHDFLKAMNPDESLLQIYIQNKVNFELSGKYINVKNNKEVIFYPDKTIAEGLTDSKKYKLEDEFDYPAEVITFDKGIRFCYKRSDTGLDIFKAKPTEDDGWTKGLKLMSLQRVSSLDISGKPELKGQFTFASTQFMIKGILRYFSVSDRRLIRNEIFARHGYIFTSEDLKKYFASQDWYKPQFTDVNDQLTDLEKLNVRLLNDFKGNN